MMDKTLKVNTPTPKGRHACVLGPRRRFVTEGKKKKKTKVTKGIFNLELSLWEAQEMMTTLL